MLLLLFISVVSNKQTNQIGQLLSNNHLPIGHKLLIQYSSYQTYCDEQGYFTLKNEKFIVNVLDQFQQTFNPQQGQKQFIIDNNESITATLRGTIINQNFNGIIKYNVSQPLYLLYNQQNISSGYFEIQFQLMKLMIYQIDISIIAKEYKAYTVHLSIYDQYIGNLENIQLDEEIVNVQFQLDRQEQVTAMCNYFGGKGRNLFKEEGQAILKGELDNEQPQYCLLYNMKGWEQMMKFDGENLIDI